MRLTKKNYQVLSAISDLNAAMKLPDHHRIAVKCDKAYAAADWAHSALRSLHAAGYIKVAGRGNGNARLWLITDAGRNALHKEMHRIF